MLEFISKYVFYPLWDLKDKSIKLKTLRELNNSQWASYELIIGSQWNKLKRILDHAVSTVPYYKRVFKDARVHINDVNSWEDIKKIPILSKAAVRQNELEMISSDYSQFDLATAKTGGSTGVALRLWFDKQCEERRNAAAIRSDQWAGWDLGIRKGALWGNPPPVDTIKKKLRRALLERVIVLDTVVMNNETMQEFCNELRAKNIKHLFGHAHSLYVFAGFCLEQEIDLPMKSIVATSMMLLDNERAVIDNAFKCRAQNRYGCEEVSLIASECEKHEGMHVNTDHVFVEILNSENAPVNPGDAGRVVVTDLINFGMPLIRYDVGDHAILSDKQCSCCRHMPLLEKVVGRVADFLIKRDGSKVAGISLIERTLTKIAGIKQMQIIQNSIEAMQINLVPGADYSMASEKALHAEIREVFGPMISCTIKKVEQIEQERNGKYRFSICRI
jgi:phenylacetate-CoA ligase